MTTGRPTASERRPESAERPPSREEPSAQQTGAGPRIGDEVRLFGRMAIFGLVLGVAYWFLTYEVAGSVMLATFGFACAIVTIAMLLGDRAGRRRQRAGDAADGTMGREAEPVAAPGWAPLGIGLGLGAVALGATFGPWLMIVGVLVAVRSGKSWLDATIDEADDARRPRR
jgi:uncharacterized membrane protein YfcA